MRLALFPLSAHLLPGGIMPLRIFEPRYQRMIAEAGESGFALCMVDPRQPDALRNMLPIATRVTIIDFDRLPDGMLGITVQGMERVQIEDLWQEQDGLRIGEVMPLTAWPPRRLHPDQQPLVEALREVFADYPDYAALYPAPLLGRWQLGGPALAGGAADPPRTEAAAAGRCRQSARHRPAQGGTGGQSLIFS